MTVFIPLSPPQGNAEGSPGFHVVLGNEACDLDSMVSALAYAYFLSKVRVTHPIIWTRPMC